MIATLGDADFKEVRIVKHGRGCCVAASRVAIHAHAIEIDERILRGQIFHAAHLVGDGVVAEIAVIGFVKGLGAKRRSHAVDADHDEPKLGKRLHVAMRGHELTVAA